MKKNTRAIKRIVETEKQHPNSISLFLESMKTMKNNYEDLVGSEECLLCEITGKIIGRSNGGCSICPHVLINGKDCNYVFKIALGSGRNDYPCINFVRSHPNLLPHRKYAKLRAEQLSEWIAMYKEAQIIAEEAVR